MKFRSLAIPLLGLALNISISAAQVLAALLLLEWAWRGFKKDPRCIWLRSELDAPILIFALWAFLSAAIHGTTGFRGALSSQSAFLLFYWAAHALDLEETESIFHWICVGAVIVGLWGIVQFAAKVNYLPVERTFSVPEALSQWPQWLVREMALNNGRAQGFRNHPLTYAETLIPGFFILLTAVVRAIKYENGHWKKALPLVLFLALMAGGFLLAQGRAVWCGLGLGILVFGWSVGRRFFFQSAAVLGLSLVLLFAVSPAIRGRFLSVVSSSSGSVGDQYSKSTRYTLWRESFEGIRAHPLMGQGLEGARLTSIDPISGQPRVWSETHNFFLQIALELGLIGLGLFSWILIVIGRMIWSLRSRWRPAMAGLFVTFLFAGLTESWTKDKEVAMIFWLMIGSLSFLFHREKA